MAMLMGHSDPPHIERVYFALEQTALMRRPHLSGQGGIQYRDSIRAVAVEIATEENCDRIAGNRDVRTMIINAVDAGIWEGVSESKVAEVIRRSGVLDEHPPFLDARRS